MIKELYWDRFSFFMRMIERENINWVLTGSYRLFLEDQRVIQPKDVDILTDMRGSIAIREIFAKYISRPFEYSMAENIKSYFGQLKIGDVDFDIMSEVYNQVDGKWIGVPNLKRVEYMVIYDVMVPILPLEVERRVCEILNRKIQLDVINKIIEKKENAENKTYITHSPS